MNSHNDREHIIDITRNDNASLGSSHNRQPSEVGGDGYGHRRRSPLNSGLWISVESLVTAGQIIASIAVLSISTNENPQALLKAILMNLTSYTATSDGQSSDEENFHSIEAANRNSQISGSLSARKTWAPTRSIQVGTKLYGKQFYTEEGSNTSKLGMSMNMTTQEQVKVGSWALGCRDRKGAHDIKMRKGKVQHALEISSTRKRSMLIRCKTSTLKKLQSAP
ncbi:unnamed protein product [Dovyalis caffra]|uniref:Uncharacterized protein n=1 Tax=Dovyalis caffra TaxID=77055 RepID=A0AAV1SSC7_9ROSI|nr:unnamed protein product [Dovyalis caffra]